MASSDVYDTLSQPVAGYDPTASDGGSIYFSFTTAPANPANPTGVGQLSSITLLLQDAEGATDNGTVTISLYKGTFNGTDFVPSGTPVIPLIATLSDAMLSASGGQVTVPVPAGYNLDADTRYWVRVAGSATSGVELAYEADASGIGAADEFYYEGGAAGPYATGPDTTGATIAQLSETLPCFCTGTLILTDRGERAVETLAPGDLVVTVSGELKPVRWIGHRSYAGRFLARNPSALPVAIAPGALGNGLPRRTLRISPHHAMLLDGVLVAALDLLNGTTIVQERGVAEVHYVHLELDRHEAVLAEGAPSETYLDDGGRAIFHRTEGYATARRRDPVYYAPRLEAGARLAEIRQRLVQHAAARVAG